MLHSPSRQVIADTIGKLMHRGTDACASIGASLSAIQSSYCNRDNRCHHCVARPVCVRLLTEAWGHIPKGGAGVWSGAVC
ncbi:MAG TPA: hypothetical protein VGE72_30665 [Azospirillum sp.]